MVVTGWSIAMFSPNRHHMRHLGGGLHTRDRTLRLGRSVYLAFGRTRSEDIIYSALCLSCSASLMNQHLRLSQSTQSTLLNPPSNSSRARPMVAEDLILLKYPKRS